jgi:hypothetical protein
MVQQNTDDDRTEEQISAMSDAFYEYEHEYRTEPKHREIVYEDDECIIIADHTGHEINEWASEFDTNRESLRSTFRSIADEKMNEVKAHEVFSYSDPVVFDKKDF